MSILNRPSRTVYPSGYRGYALGMTLDFIIKVRQRIRDFFDGKNKVPILQGVETFGWLLIFGGGGFVVGALMLAFLNDVQSDAVLLVPFATAGVGLLAYPIGKQTIGFLRTTALMLAIPLIAITGMDTAGQFLAGQGRPSGFFFGAAAGVLVGLLLYLADFWLSQRMANQERAELVLGLLMLPGLLPLGMVVWVLALLGVQPDPIFGTYLFILLWFLAGPRGG